MKPITVHSSQANSITATSFIDIISDFEYKLGGGDIQRQTTLPTVFTSNKDSADFEMHILLI
jgi:hypothetical protein